MEFTEGPTLQQYPEAYPELWQDLPYRQPSVEQWRLLYQAAIAIKKQKPWQLLWDDELIVLYLPDRQEPVFLSVLGKEETCYGIAVYPGYRAFQGCLLLREADEDEPDFISSGYQNELVCYFGDREELLDDDMQVLRQLELGFRGKGQWVYFRCHKSGRMPWKLTADQATLLTQILQGLTGAFDDLKQGEVAPDFEKDQVLGRHFHSQTGVWQSRVEAAPPIPVISPRLIVTDQLFVARLKKARSNGGSLELDLPYLPLPYFSEKIGMPVLPQICLLMDRNGQELRDQYMLEEEDDPTMVIMGMLTEHIKNNGRPRKLFVRDSRMGFLLEDLCKKLSIELLSGMGMPAVDYFVESMANFIQE